MKTVILSFLCLLIVNMISLGNNPEITPSDFTAPDGVEVCNGIDDDGDGLIDEDVTHDFYADLDFDGYGNPEAGIHACEAPEGYVDNDTDCNDADDHVNPGVDEICNAIDDNCNGLDDEGVLVKYFADADHDAFGDEANWMYACAQPVGYVENWSDCNDADIAVNPDAAELCNALDDDCDGAADDGITQKYFADLDADNFGDEFNFVIACDKPEGYLAEYGDCDDYDAAISPAAFEICNGLDDNCNGNTDEPVMTPGIFSTNGYIICQPGSVDLQASPDFALSYQWRKDGNDIPGATTASLTATKGGIYTVIISYDGVCYHEAPEILVKSYKTPKPTVHIVGGINDLCLNPAITLKTIPGESISYQWFRNHAAIEGANGMEYTTTETGIYTVQITTIAGCSSTSAKTFITNTCDGFRLAEPEALPLKLYPNPARKTVTISMEQPFAETESVWVEMVDLQGRTLLRKEIQGTAYGFRESLEIPENANPGLYHLRILSNGLVETRSLTISE